MASCNEKTLLNEITYLTRLIDQHKKSWSSSNGNWSATRTSTTRTSNYQNGDATSHPYHTIGSQVRGTVSYKYVKSPVNTTNRNWTHGNRVMQKSNIYIAPRCNKGSTSKQQKNSDAKFSTCFIDSEDTNVHINPHFNQEKSTKTVKVHLNPNFPLLSGTKHGKEAKLTKKDNTISSPEGKLKVHLNPNFCKLLPDNSPHTQLRTLMSNKVHVNPKLVEKVLKEKNDSETSSVSPCSVRKLVPPVGYCSDGAIGNGYLNKVSCGKSAFQGGDNKTMLASTKLQKSEFLVLGKRKLFRVTPKVGGEVKHKDKLRSPRNGFVSKHKLSTMSSPSSSIKKAKAITSKYKLVKVQSTTQMSVARKSATGTKYKIDRRSLSTKSRQHNCVKLRENYRDVSQLKKDGYMKVPSKQVRLVTNSTRSLSGNMVWRRTWSLQAKEFRTSNTKLYRIGRSPALRRKNNVGEPATFNKSLVRIGGVLYKSSRNKLTRSHPGAPAIGGKLSSPASLKKKGKAGNKGQVLFIRGQKFMLDKQGKILRRLSSSSSTNINKQSITSLYSFRRVDIGGVTFVKKSSDLLMRTNTHKARSLLSHAKQKSISTLVKKLKKNNQPCMFFQKFGRCFRWEKGTCPCVHDRKHVAVCKRFLQAKCDVNGCLLSHDVVPEKMPTCKYFLEGCCNRVNCPYLHVKVNEKADICSNFLQGYCSNGKKCKKRHINICPEYEKNGKCMKGKHCPYPHKTIRSKKNVLRKRGAVVVSKMTTLHTYNRTVEAKNINSQSNAKNELMRYYLAPKEVIGEVDASSHMELTEEKQITQKFIDRCVPEVSSTCDSVHVVASRDSKPSSFKRIFQRDKIGSLPSFIPL